MTDPIKRRSSYAYEPLQRDTQKCLPACNYATFPHFTRTLITYWVLTQAATLWRLRPNDVNALLCKLRIYLFCDLFVFFNAKHFNSDIRHYFYSIFFSSIGFQYFALKRSKAIFIAEFRLHVVVAKWSGFRWRGLSGHKPSTFTCRSGTSLSADHRQPHFYIASTAKKEQICRFNSIVLQRFWMNNQIQ